MPLRLAFSCSKHTVSPFCQQPASDIRESTNSPSYYTVRLSYRRLQGGPLLRHSRRSQDCVMGRKQKRTQKHAHLPIASSTDPEVRLAPKRGRTRFRTLRLQAITRLPLPGMRQVESLTGRLRIRSLFRPPPGFYYPQYRKERET